MTNARINGRLSAIALAVALIGFGLACAAATLEDRHVRVEIGEKGELVSLVCKATGHDWAGTRASLGLFIHDRDTPADKGENGLSNARVHTCAVNRRRLKCAKGWQAER